MTCGEHQWTVRSYPEMCKWVVVCTGCLCSYEATDKAVAIWERMKSGQLWSWEQAVVRVSRAARQRPCFLPPCDDWRLAKSVQLPRRSLWRWFRGRLGRRPRRPPRCLLDVCPDTGKPR